MTTPEDPSDRLIDSLLREQARRRAADEELIASIHAALDGAGGQTSARTKRFSPRLGLLLASAAAVVLVAGGIALNRRGEGVGTKDLAMEPVASKGRDAGPERRAAKVAERPAAQAKMEASKPGEDALNFPPMEKGLAIQDPSSDPSWDDLLAGDAKKLKVDGVEAKGGGVPPAVASAVEAAAAWPVSPAAAAVPKSAGAVKFLAWDDSVAKLKIDIVNGDQGRLITDFHPLKRTAFYRGPDSNAPLKLGLEGRKNADGSAAVLDVDLQGFAEPLVLVLANDKGPSGLAAVVINDDEANFKWGSWMVFNGTKGDLAMVVDNVAFKVPTGWQPVLITPKGTNEMANVQLRTYKEPNKVAYSMVWPAERDTRLLVVLIPSNSSRLGEIATKTVPETKAGREQSLAGAPAVAAAPAAAIAALPKTLPIMPEPATPRPGLSEGTVARRVQAGESTFVFPDAPSEALADAPLPLELDGGRGAGSGGGSGGSGGTGAGRGVGNGTEPGRGAGAALSPAAPAAESRIDSLVDRANGAAVAGISHDAIPGRSRAFEGERGVVQPNDGANGERYGQLVDQPWKSPWQDALSTFSIDVDAASYTNIRRMIRTGVSIPADAVRIEECLNYFDYRYEGPKGNGPFAVTGTLVKSPLQAGHLLARVAIKGREIEKNARPASNLVFLIDVSGSMQDTMKLPLLQRSLELLVDQLDERDHLGIVVYAGNEGVVLDSTRLTGDGKTRALQALKKLEAGGSTNGGAGIKRAYQMAASHFIPGGVNRVILATDGDFNVGTTSQNDLVELVKEKAKSGVNLTVTSFGDGNLNDSMLEAITKDGNGNYYYIDSDNEGRRIFLEKLTGTLVTIAKDVKIQVEFNPGKVKAYRLLGYADRILKHEDFNNDKVDAGDIGAGHTVTALYEIVPQGAEMPNLGGVDPLRYQKPEGREMVASEEWLTLKLRYKAPDGDLSSLVETPLKGEPQAWEESGNDMRFASAVALFGMKLRGMPEAKEVPWSRVIELAKPALAEDPHEQRAEFLELVRKLEK